MKTDTTIREIAALTTALREAGFLPKTTRDPTLAAMHAGRVAGVLVRFKADLAELEALSSTTTNPPSK